MPILACLDLHVGRPCQPLRAFFLAAVGPIAQWWSHIRVVWVPLAHISDTMITHVMMELIAYETWHGVMWLRWRRSRQDLAWRTGCKCEGWVGGFGVMDCVTVKLEQDLALMDKGNVEKQVRSRSMNQQGHVMIWSGSYHLLIKVGAYVASTLEEMEWIAQGKGITYRVFYFTSHSCVEKFMTWFRIDGRTIKRDKLVCISII
jgi:hypothetical protein